MKLIISAAIIAVAIIAVLVFTGSRSTNLVFNTAPAHTETIETNVMATGYIQPVEEVEVGTQVSGTIEKIYVDFNSHVKAGQLLAELDRSTLNEKLTQANAALNKAKSDLTYAEQNYNRTKQLHDAKAATDVSLEEAVNKLAQAKTAVSDANANARQARVNRDYAFIYSPIDGVVLDRQVNVGQTVAASFNTPTLFTIAEDLTKMQVEVDVDEADIGHVRVGQKAIFTVDAYNDQTFEGTVNQIRLQPTVTNNVVTYTVIVEAPNPDEKLFPGMTANITIIIESQTGTAVPVEALTFHVTPNMDKYIAESADRATVTSAMENTVSAQMGFHAGNHYVWVLEGEKLAPRAVTTTLNDGINTIVTSGLNEGEQVVLSASEGKKGSKKASVSFMPRPR